MEPRKPASFLWMYPVLLVFALAILGWGIYLMALNHADRIIFVAGCLAVLGTLLAWFLTLNIRGISHEVAVEQQAAAAALAERVGQVQQMLTQISAQQLISERAKAIAFRFNEREAMRKAIREETDKKDYEAALALANQMETVFGYRAEAEGIRQEIRALRDQEMRRQIDEGMAVIDRHCRGEQWSMALREAERLLNLFPEDAQAQKLPADIEQRRMNFKKQLLESWNDAVSRHDVDTSIEILKQLDLYLTPAEAQAMQETARQVFKDKLLLLGQQFTMAVKERRWAEAIRLGEGIVTEFPNSRMAQEVREKMDLLRQRAAEPASAQPARV